MLNFVLQKHLFRQFNHNTNNYGNIKVIFKLKLRT